MQSSFGPEHAAIVGAFVQKFIGLGLNATVSKVEPGPVVTAYYFKPHNSIPLAKILNKEEDFAMAAGVDKVTIQRVKGDVVIFAANKERKFVDYKDYLTWFMTDEKVKAMAIPIAIGIDHLGNKAALDLVEQPHILLAGATGSGKSVYESAIISSLAAARTDKELRLILVDTKQLDLPLFKELPHVDDVCTDLKSYLRMMEDLIKECESRTNMMKGVARNIREYNALGNSLPYKVLIIDEFGDLLARDREKKKEKFSVEADYGKADDLLKRLVQISRAAGIHVIAGTQRTSVKIVDGDIKANFPCRISLQLPTRFDSTTILGQDGAETLLGKGDMLVLPPSSETMLRYHGPFVKQEDIAWIVGELDYVRSLFKTIK